MNKTTSSQRALMRCGTLAALAQKYPHIKAEIKRISEAEKAADLKKMKAAALGITVEDLDLYERLAGYL